MNLNLKEATSLNSDLRVFVSGVGEGLFLVLLWVLR
jgi:hypothetical protein